MNLKPLGDRVIVAEAISFALQHAKAGDTVMFGKYAGDDITVEDVE